MGSVRKNKTKRRTRDLDQIHADLHSTKHLTQFKNTKAAEDLPGLGRHYCVECSKWFEGEYNLEAHRRSKNHKRRVRLLKEKPYTQKEAEAAAGLQPAGGEGFSFEAEADAGTTGSEKTTNLDMEIEA